MSVTDSMSTLTDYDAERHRLSATAGMLVPKMASAFSYPMMYGNAGTAGLLGGTARVPMYVWLGSHGELMSTHPELLNTQSLLVWLVERSENMPSQFYHHQIVLADVATFHALRQAVELDVRGGQDVARAAYRLLSILDTLFYSLPASSLLTVLTRAFHRRFYAPVFNDETNISGFSLEDWAGFLGFDTSDTVTMMMNCMENVSTPIGVNAHEFPIEYVRAELGMVRYGFTGNQTGKNSLHIEAESATALWDAVMSVDSVAFPRAILAGDTAVVEVVGDEPRRLGGSLLRNAVSIVPKLRTGSNTGLFPVSFTASHGWRQVSPEKPLVRRKFVGYEVVGGQLHLNFGDASLPEPGFYVVMSRPYRQKIGRGSTPMWDHGSLRGAAPLVRVMPQSLADELANMENGVVA